MGLEYIDIGNPGSPNNDPATGAPYNPDHLLIPAHINAPGGVLVIFNNSTVDLFFTFPYNRYRIKVPATQKRQVTLQTPEPQGIKYQVGNTTATLLGTPDVYIETYAPGECVPPFNEAASGVAVASGGIPVTVAAVKGWTYTSPLPNPFGPFNILSWNATVAGFYQFSFMLEVLDQNTNPADEVYVFAGNFSDPKQNNGAVAVFVNQIQLPAGSTPKWLFADQGTGFPGPNAYNGVPIQAYAAIGDLMQIQVGINNNYGVAYVYDTSIRIDAALVLLQPY